MGNLTWESTADDVLAGVDLKGTRALVTGVSAGLGVETSRALLARGAEVVGTARDLAKARTAMKDIIAQYGDKFKLAEMDLASLASVRKCADALNAEGKPFRIVIANAGVMMTPPGKTADGYELQFGTNHVGHFVFINRIAKLIPSGGRLVNLSSSAHQFGDLDLDDFHFEKRAYDPTVSYAASKVANVLFTIEFDRRHKARGVRAAAVHPGGIMTELMRHLTPDTFKQLAEKAAANAGDNPEGAMRVKTVPQGASTPVWAATAPGDLVGGRYCEDNSVAEVNAKGSGGVRPYAVDAERAKQLWAKTEKLVGETFA
jgi:NAD(P)-dependent dehydrogenase (short-subunit alcohol dehydrogenase family)